MHQSNTTVAALAAAVALVEADYAAINEMKEAFEWSDYRWKERRELVTRRPPKLLVTNRGTQRRRFRNIRRRHVKQHRSRRV